MPDTRHALRIEHLAPTHRGGWTVRFGCTCRAYTGDRTWGRTEAAARAAAREHVRTHAALAAGADAVTVRL